MMDNSSNSSHSVVQNQQGNNSLNSDIIAELQNSSYETETVDNSQLTSVFIEYDDPVSQRRPSGQTQDGSLTGYENVFEIIRKYGTDTEILTIINGATLRF